MTHSAAHTSFVLERRFKSSPARVFQAWADPDAKRRWNDCHAEVGTTDYTIDFRVGGHELHRAILPDGKKQLVDKVFLEIVPDARILFAYSMEAGGRSLSASLVTVEFHADGSGTFLKLTEQLAYLDGHDDLQQRIEGTSEGLDRLFLELAEDLPTH
ncbi:SRPBCC family protein [Roseiterribacter gracilis]|uniref:Activator of HSP90 ATPase n=1 Tax=Roseiterribacter gracilis TaxID=2812848 RepID=A0A8S8XJ09_9PROT|nr:activator of HSP90 ATPase [Rhodospirillales bacterium TMPK1]